MADYNVNMKKFNGTDYDNLLPLAYNALNSQQLVGKTFDEIQTLFGTIYRIERQATNTYRESFPTVVTFPVSISCLIFKSSIEPEPPSLITSSISPTLLTENIPFDSFQVVYLDDNKTKWFSIKKTTDNKTFTIIRNSAESQYNSSQNRRSVFYGLGGIVQGSPQSIFFIQESSVWTVPYTRKYYIEVYGGGGDGFVYNYGDAQYWSGGSSCQSYKNVFLEEGEKITVVVGKGRRKTTQDQSGNGQSSSFGSYTVEGGGGASRDHVGQGVGDLGTNGQAFDDLTTTKDNYSNGTLASKIMGYGGILNGGGNGGIVLKYLGS